jgi:hypothetical protein
MKTDMNRVSLARTTSRPTQRETRFVGPTDVAKPTYRENKRSNRTETDHRSRNKNISSRDKATLALVSLLYR